MDFLVQNTHGYIQSKTSYIPVWWLKSEYRELKGISQTDGWGFFFCQIKKCSKIVDIRYVGQKSSELLIFRGAPPKNVSPSSSNIQKISRSIEIINFDHPRGEDGKRLQKQETYPDLMYDGAHHMVASISDGYCDTMSGTLSGLLNLTQTPKHVFHIRILFGGATK